MSWPTVKSGELFSFITSGSRGWARYYADAGSPFLRVGNLDHDSIALDLREIQYVAPPAGAEGVRTRVQASDILISVTADVGMVGLVPSALGEAYINQHVALARPLPLAHPAFLAWYLASPSAQMQFRQLQRGATKVGLGLDDIRSVDVPLPPVPEQRRIVAEIEKQFTRLEAGVAALRRVQANLKRYRAAVLKAACEGRLVPTEAELARLKPETRNRKPSYETGEQLLARILVERRKNWQGRGKYKEPAAPDTANLPPLPEGWAWASLDQLMLNITDGDHLPPPQTETGVPFLVIGNVRGSQLNFDDTRFVSREYFEGIESYRRPQRGDILFSLVGSYGIAVRVDTDKEFCIQRHLGVLRPHEISPADYLLHALNSRFVYQQASATATGTAQKTVPLAALRRFVIPLPPLAEQQRIVAEVERRLSVVDELEAVVSANLQRATRLRQAVLQKAFAGELV